MNGTILFAIIMGTFIYFVPTIIAFSQGKKNRGAILALNLFLGWSFVGWVVSLVWALTHEEEIKK